jgi:hypothetical protein
MSVTATVGTFLFGKLGDLIVEDGAKGLWAKIKERRARQALANACATAIEAAIGIAPALAEDLRSESFGGTVVLPLVQDLLQRPSQLTDAETFANRYVKMFVERLSARDGVDATLIRIFQTERSELVGAFQAFLGTLKSELYAVESWREAQHFLTTERMATQTDRISAQLGHLTSLLEERDADARVAKVDVERARSDAATASAEMRAWPSEIHGLRLETPALDRLIARVTDNPAGRTLLIGDAGTGKSALMARVAASLEEEGLIVFAIKADQLPATLASLGDLAQALGVKDGLEDRIAALAGVHPVALLIDQLDAVSDVMDRQSYRMQLLLQLVHRLGARSHAGGKPLAIHVVVSSRPFEAAHDARFQQLNAEPLRLDLLREAQVDAMFAHLGVDPLSIDAALRETLRRPFALKLFADIIARGGDGHELTPAGLLDAWLATADLGAGTKRKATTAFLLELAEEMVATETLWRPADALDIQHGAAVSRAEAAGLVVRSDGKLGFSHQSWLDDFQAKTFRTGRDLADYAWERQDTLFIRASILRALERLRVRDVNGYQAALSALLGSKRTRRHILHLIADIVATSSSPLPFEITWVDHWIREDAPLAARALRQIIPHWARWRDGLRQDLPELMTREAFHWQAARLLATEVKFDSDHVAMLIDRFWTDASSDRLVFDILRESDFVGLGAHARLRTIFGRTKIDDHAVAHMIQTFTADARFEDAAEVVALWLEFQPMAQIDHPKLYDLDKLAEAAPLTLAMRLIPWFIGLVTRDVGPEHQIVTEFPRSHSLPYAWDVERGQGNPFEALHLSIKRLGETAPDSLWDLLEPLTAIDIDQVQELIAVGLTAAGPALAGTSLQYLLADPRRFRISHIIASNSDGMIDAVQGWFSHQLVRAIVSGLDEAQLASLRDAIESWSSYTDFAMQDEDAETVSRRERSRDEERFPLLEPLPENLLSQERRGQIAQWRLGNPPVDPWQDDDAMSGWIGPPITHQEMGDADDDEIWRQLDEFHDGSGDHRWTRPLSRSGGVRELARAFGEFGKTAPERAIGIAARLKPERHEAAAGNLVRELGDAEAADPKAVLGLILELDACGFGSPEWRQDAADGLRKLAARLDGLDDGVVGLLGSWIDRDPDSIAREIAERLSFEANNRNRDTRDDAHPLLFGAGGGMQVLPHANFTILSAMAAGLLHREEPAWDQWAEVLERHVEHPEDPAIWTSLLMWRGKFLRRAEPERATKLLGRIWQRFPEALQDSRIISFWWQLRDRMPDDALIGTVIWWLASADPRAGQAAAEFLTAAHLVAPEDWRYKLLFGRLDPTRTDVETGLLFSAAAAWRENDPALRSGAHALLMAAIGTATGPAAQALARAIDTRPQLVSDALTRELLAALPANAEVLRAALNRRFADALQNLLLYPGFEEEILDVIEKATQLITESGAQRLGILGEELVHVAIALQRSSNAIRSRAMDVYERLLDAAVYGAEEAAKASLAR